VGTSVPAPQLIPSRLGTVQDIETIVLLETHDPAVHVYAMRI
jgi:hypothetical protein